jgi:site-specific DNA recombinase
MRHHGRRPPCRPVHQLRTKPTQLRARRDELTLNDEPTTTKPATLTQIANHITEIITSGTHNQTKALVEALIAKVTITAPDRLIPIFRILTQPPQPTNSPGKTAPTAAVAHRLNRWSVV